MAIDADVTKPTRPRSSGNLRNESEFPAAGGPATVGAALGLTRALQHIRTAMDADESVLLMLDATGSVLEPVASVGLDRTSRASVRVPVGRGFAGRVASERQPVILAEVTPANVLNPVLRAHGITTLLGVPLLEEDGALVGVLHVGTTRPRDFTEDDVTALVAFAADLLDTIRQQATGAEHTAALVLQRSLVPTIPASIPGLDIAARYVPAEGDLGGDWYDVFPLPGDRVGIVMGDVVGHGLNAAVVMGRLKSALRAYSLISDSPSEALSLLDHKISHFEPGTLATVVYGIATAPYDEITFSSAGHYPPVIVDPCGNARQPLVPQGLLLGVEPDRPRRDFTVALPPRATVCLFTDGLLEIRKGADRTTVSLDVLEQTVAGIDAEESVEQACTRILTNVVGTAPNDDDIALMVIRRMPDGLPAEPA